MQSTATSTFLNVTEVTPLCAHMHHKLYLFSHQKQLTASYMHPATLYAVLYAQEIKKALLITHPCPTLQLGLARHMALGSQNQ